jgi:hypothetical protein
MPVYNDPPRPASSAPPGVQDNSTLGTAAGFYAMGDHTHASKARKARVSVAAVTSYAWTYPTAFGAGVVPIVNGIAEVVAGNTDLINVQILGTPTNTGCVFQITRYSQGLIALVTGVLALNATPFTGALHLTAFEP